MWFKLVIVVIVLAIASSGNARPHDPDPLDDSNSQEVTEEAAGAVNRSRQVQHRELKDIQNMDQSLRTVATQLLNTTVKHENLVRIPEEKIVTIETPMQVVHISTRIEDAVSDISNDKEDDETKMKFGIPINSKFGHFEVSNPGHAMAMTEEEIEREMATTEASIQKYRSTTKSMLSTWIQLYPPSTTTERNNVSEIKTEIPDNEVYSLTSTKLPSTTFNKLSTAYNKLNRNTEIKLTTIPSTESSLSTTKFIKNSSIIDVTNNVQLSSTLSTVTIENKTNGTASTEKKLQNQRTNASVHTITKSTTPLKKLSTKGSNSLKPKITTPKNAVTKVIKNNSTVNRFKPLATRRPNKNDTVTSTSKIEKVTFKPTIYISQNQISSTEKSPFVTKIKASILTNSQKSNTNVPTVKPIHSILSKSNFSATETSTTKIPSPTQVNNVLKVSLKKPVDDSTKIEIQPIRVNPPVLTIEQIEDLSLDQKTNNDNQDILENSKIDVKFDFSPEYTNVKLQIPSAENSSSIISTTTTKRPRLSHKRKKNKNRRRKPSTTTISTLAIPSTATFDNINLLPLDTTNTINNVNRDKIQLSSIQESKIEPESKAPPSKKKKPNQTQVQKPIGTQIYNFLSREVMPSVGVMSLVGLGLGLASYFLYPFGGVIARRNYDVEPNYKYNLDEYGGNYGLSEEEVLSKVYSGMTGGQHHDSKYNFIATSEKNPTYYRYTGSEHVQQQTSRYPVLPFKNAGNRVVYRPVETTSYDGNYRNTEFKYPDVPTTPNYYERQRQQQLSTDFVSTAPKVGMSKNRQFVVGNVPKEYSSKDVEKSFDVIKIQDKIDHNLSYSAIEKNSENNLSAEPLTAPDLKSLNNPASFISKNNKKNSAEIYEEMEISPTAVAVEHGPRFLKSLDDDLNVKSAAVPKLIRKKRNIFFDVKKNHAQALVPALKRARIERSSVIQVIPSKSEIERESKMQEQEENLSNEILNIIDDALPDKIDYQKKKYNDKHESTMSATTKKPYNKVSDTLRDSISKGTSSSTLPDTSIISDILGSTDGNIISTSEKKIRYDTYSTSSTTMLITTNKASSEELTESNVNQTETISDWQENIKTTTKPTPPTNNGIDILGIAKRIAEIKLRLGLTILKHASEGLARYIGHIQKRFNGEE
ncbi:PREDICTED: uncharacterized protein LOC105367458 [Ceratosolen solmsi marchali]|uniref:Uncharacterized protein LOC105367458 n=1 Tax=Ceratosolen solmsi marchali TaxID=326594 RepID=A0AAJ6YU47_9HYME|nr:PREDICTED: uncharacterized protein LOC105367458 [Ceratosolen solmsi marchali]XP_011504485.1 PREDICTED: uncharacterized protein LOC105367458 [Ceratosolen solmsi marchali]